MDPMLHGNSLVLDGKGIRKLLAEVERDHEIRDLRRRLADKDVEFEHARPKSKGR